MPTDTTRDNPPPRHLFAWRLALAVYWCLLAFATHWPSLSFVQEVPRAPDDPHLLLQQDKPMHLCAFAVLATLLVLARPLGRHRPRRANALAAAGVALGYAVIDEATQTFAIDRSASASDLLANALGIVGVLMFTLTPARDRLVPATQSSPARLRLLAGCGALAVGGVLLAATHMVNRETVALHFFAAAALTLSLLRAAPPLPRRPRLSNLLICASVLATVALGEIAQGYTGLPFSRAEVFYAMVGLLLAMTLWTGRLAFGPGRPGHASPASASSTTPAKEGGPDTDPATATPPRA